MKKGTMDIVVETEGTYVYEIRYISNPGNIKSRCWYTTREEAASTAEEILRAGQDIHLIREHKIPVIVDDVIGLAMWLDNVACDSWG